MPRKPPIKIEVEQVWRMPAGRRTVRFSGHWRLVKAKHEIDWRVIRIQNDGIIVLQLNDDTKLYGHNGIYIYLEPHVLRNCGRLVESKIQEVAT